MLRDRFLGYQVRCGWFFGIVQIACTFIDIILGICLSFLLFRIRKPCFICIRLSWLLYFGSVASYFYRISSLGYLGNRGCFGMYLLATVFAVFWWFQFWWSHLFSYVFYLLWTFGMAFLLGLHKFFFGSMYYAGFAFYFGSCLPLLAFDNSQFDNSDNKLGAFFSFLSWQSFFNY